MSRETIRVEPSEPKRPRSPARAMAIAISVLALSLAALYAGGCVEPSNWYTDEALVKHVHVPVEGLSSGQDARLCMRVVDFTVGTVRDLAFKEEEYVSQGRRVYLDSSGDFDCVLSQGGYLNTQEHYLAFPEHYAVSPDGTVYRTGASDLPLEQHEALAIVIDANGSVEVEGSVVCEAIDMTTLSDDDVAQVVETFTNDPEHNDNVDELRQAILTKREEANSERKRMLDRVDYATVAQSYESLLDAWDSIGFGDERLELEAASVRRRYGLADINGDGVPELLLRKDVRISDVSHYHTFIRCASYDPQTKEAHLVGPTSGKGSSDEEWAKYELSDINYGYRLNDDDTVMFRHYVGVAQEGGGVYDVLRIRLSDKYDPDGEDADLRVPGIDLHSAKSEGTARRLTLREDGLALEDRKPLMKGYGSLRYFILDNRSELQRLSRGDWGVGNDD